MKVILVNTEKSWRGGEKQTFFLLRELREMGVETGLIAPAGGELFKQAKQLGVEVFAASGWVGTFCVICRIAGNWDVVHAQTAKAHTACAFACLFKAFKLCYTRRVLFAPRGKWFNCFKYSRTDRVFAVSKAAAGRLEEYGFGKAQVIHSCIQPGKVNDAEVKRIFAALGIGEQKRVIVSLAALDRFKDPFCELDAVELLSKRRQDFVFVHFGVGPLEQAVKAEIKKRRLDEFYKLGGFAPRVENVLARASVFVMTSRIEAFANSLLEAFYFGVPAVVSDSQGLCEIAGNGERGVVCAAGNGQAFCDGIDLLLCDGSKARGYVEKAADYVKEFTDTKAYALKYFNAYKDL